MTDVIRVSGVSKQFALRKDKSLKERLVNARRSRENAEEFWALRDIDVTFASGSTTGLIGHNGSGKSTLLKIIGGILTPTTGYVERRGRLAALLELGAGFHGDLTGRENVYLNAAILGLTRKQTDAYFDEIVDFSGIESFIDTQVKFYSSGMYVRLAFAVAVHVDPEILLVDEVLSVGDEPFQRKCLDRIRRFQREGRTIVFVSHSLDQVRQLCDRAVLLDHGRQVVDGTPTEAVRAFRDLNQAAEEAEEEKNVDLAAQGTRRVTISEVSVADSDGRPVRTLPSGAGLQVRFRVDPGSRLDDWIVGVAVEDSGGQVVWGANSDMQGFTLPELSGGPEEVTVEFPEVPLSEGVYQVSVAVASTGNRTVYHRVNRVATFRVVTDAYEDGAVHLAPGYRVADRAVPRGGVPLDSVAGER
ncbi:ABC transporter ATP-binding protein [Blastococcus sp. TML/M2B]|uniref:ABC transporter ATP-binding protein n=2 Tax=unclassified Blastococcus TaxID=2619396 RepID=UPI0019094F59|nr:ABC transporter ATP-binding protein [Blastococcus sp. TML/M2B]MBN1093819.1 ABC transporter ATP-binding protein [Blastococcus sp. TML/M2B]